jgi:hypothetical protein
MPYHQLTHTERHNLHHSSIRDEAEQAGMSIEEYLRTINELSNEQCEILCGEAEWN